MNLTKNFIFPLPKKIDNFFKQTLILICEHNEEGAMGFIVNKTCAKENFLFKKNDLKHVFLKSLPFLNLGGPIGLDNIFILHPNKYKFKNSFLKMQDLSLTMFDEFYFELKQNKEIYNLQEDFIFLIGYSGWAPGQLENEIKQNLWLNIPYNSDLIFKTPIEKRLDFALKKLGISDLNLINFLGNA